METRGPWWGRREVVGAATALNVAVGLSAALRALHAAAHSLRQPSGGAEEYSGLSGATGLQSHCHCIVGIGTLLDEQSASLLPGVVPFSALKIAAWRAIETELGSVALFNDPLAASLAGTTAVAAAKSRLVRYHRCSGCLTRQLAKAPYDVRTQTDNTPMPSRLAIRTRYFDDKLTQALEVTLKMAGAVVPLSDSESPSIANAHRSLTRFDGQHTRDLHHDWTESCLCLSVSVETATSRAG